MTIRSTEIFNGVVFDQSKIVCSRMHGWFGDFWVKTSVIARRNPSKSYQCTAIFQWKSCVTSFDDICVVYRIEAHSILYLVVLSNLLRVWCERISMHMSRKNPFLIGVGLLLRGVLNREFYGSTTKTLPY